MQFREANTKFSPNENQQLILSTHLFMLEKEAKISAIVHRWTGMAVKATPGLLTFLDLFKHPTSMRDLQRRFFIDHLETKIGQLLELGFLLDITTDEEVLWLQENIGIDKKKVTYTDNFLAYYPLDAENIIPRFLNLMGKVYQALLSRGLGKLNRKSIVFICNAADEYKKLWGNAAIHDGLHFFVTKGRILTAKLSSIQAFDFSDNRIFKAMVHEMVHIFLCQQYTNLPVWAVEGICEYYSQPQYNTSFKELVLFKKPFLFRQIEEYCTHSMFDIDRAPMEYNIGYRQSHSFMNYLSDNVGEKRLLKCIFNTGLSRDFRSVFQAHFSQPLKNMEMAWRNKVLRHGSRNN